MSKVEPSHHSLKIIARAALLSSMLTLVGIVLAPPPILQDFSWATGAQTRFGILFVVALLAQAALPQLKRSDITLLAFVFACGVELPMGLFGREIDSARLLAGLLGVAAAWAPGLVDRFRSRYREQPFTSVLGK